MPTNIRFAGYPDAVIYKNPNGTKRKGKSPLQHLIWGDWIRLILNPDNTLVTDGDFVKVHTRGEDGWVHKDDIQTNRLLEVAFVDIGQGDGCLLVTPDDKHMVIDAGEGDNMARYLRWRYGGFETPWEFESAVISHPDADHYGGFEEIFKEDNVTFGTVYHNGIMPQKAAKASASLGAKTSSGSPRYLTGLIHDVAELKAFLADTSRWKSKDYPAMLETGLGNGRFAKFQALSEDDNYLPGYDNNHDFQIKILGPVGKRNSNNKLMLPWLINAGKTKNGHSVVLKAQYHNVSILLGGDLNVPAEKHLLQHHTGSKSFPRSDKKISELIEKARKVFQVDIAKSCHHGSSDFSSTFLSAVNPIATVISSGDDEPYSHPRADALGTIGLFSRGERPLIFSTELARSSKELVGHPNILRKELENLNKAIDNAPENTAKERRAKEKLEKQRKILLDKTINRSIAVFGTINLRTDGHKVIIAQKLERPRGKGQKWDIYRLEPNTQGTLHYIYE